MFSLFSLFYRVGVRRRTSFLLLAVSALTVATAFAQESRSSRGLAAVPKDGVKRALLVGVDDYAEFADLKYAVADVEAIRGRLVELGFKPENIVELKSTSPANLRPSQRYIRRQVDALLKAAGPNDLLFLHFSGHGFQSDGVVRFAPEDAIATGDEEVVDPETTISLTEIIERLKTSQAKFKWLIVDACRENPTGTRSAAANARALKNIDPPKGMLVLQSCSEGELSYEDAENGRGLFTGRLLEAFDGKADFDGDGAMSALDVCKYVSEQTLAASKKRFNAAQTPRATAEDFGDFIIAEDLKVDGLGRAEWVRADSLYEDAKKLYVNENYSAAETKINAALLVVKNVPETNEKKRRYLATQDDVARASLRSSNAFKLFGKLTRRVATVAELEEAVKNAKDNDVIEIAAGTYRLNETLQVWGNEVKKLTLVGATGDKDDVRLIIDGTDKVIKVIASQYESAALEFADLSLEAEWYVLEVDEGCAATATRCSFTCAEMSALECDGGDLVLNECNVRNKEKKHPIAVKICGGDKKGGSLKAKNCDFIGSVEFCGKGSYMDKDVGGTMRLEKCKIHDCNYGVNVRGCPPDRVAQLNMLVKRIETGSGALPPSSKSRCEIVDCEIKNCFTGVDVSERGQVFVRGCKISDCEHSAVNSCFSTVYIEETDINDCRIGLYLGDDSECDAVKLTYVGVDKRWSVYQLTGGPSRVTIDGEDVASKRQSSRRSR